MNQITSDLPADLMRQDVRKDVPAGWTILDLTPKGDVGGPRGL